MTGWIVLLRIFQALCIVGVLTLIRNAYIKRRIEGKSLAAWARGLMIGGVLGTILFGTPFFIAAYFAKSFDSRWAFVQLGVFIGTLLPLWLDSLLTFRHASEQYQPIEEQVTF